MSNGGSRIGVALLMLLGLAVASHRMFVAATEHAPEREPTPPAKTGQPALSSAARLIIGFVGVGANGDGDASGLAARVHGVHADAVAVDGEWSPSAGFDCREKATIAFELADEADVRVVALGPDGAAGETEELRLPIGLHVRTLPAGTATVRIEASSGARTDRHEAAIWRRAIAPELLPLGHTLIEGVLLFDGHLTHSETDLDLEGLGPDLSFERTYSSTIGDAVGTVGRGWRSVTDARVRHDSCGHILAAAGGTYVNYFEAKREGRFRPLYGHHSTLERLPVGWRMTAKDGTRYEFNEPDGASFRLSTITDPHGNRVLHRYVLLEGWTVLAQIEDATGRKLEFTYRMRTLRAGERVLERRPLLTQVDGPGGWRLMLEHDASGNLVATTVKDDSALGTKQQSFAYEDFADADGERLGFRLVRIDDLSQQTWTGFGYERAMGIARDADARHALTRLVRHRKPDNGVVAFAYKGTPGAGPVSTVVTSARGPATTYEMDVNGLVVATRKPSGTSTSEWDVGERLVTQSTDANGRIIEYAYDTHGNKLRETLRFGSSTPVVRSWDYVPASEFQVPIRNRIKSATDGRGLVTRYHYDSRGNMLSSERAGTAERWRYGKRGELLAAIAIDGTEVRYEYDTNGYLALETGEVGDKRFRHDARGRLLEEVDAGGATRTWRYDVRDRVLQRSMLIIDDEDAIASVMFDDRARRKVATHRNGGKSVFDYDEMGRLLKLVDPDGRVYTKQWDLHGNLLREIDFARSITTYRYDDSDRLVERKGPGKEDIVEYAYDRYGNMTAERTRGADRDELAEQRFDHPLYKPTWSRFTRKGEPTEVWFREFDGNGNCTRLRGDDGHDERFEYDAFDRPRPVSQRTT
jgi:YD repeat-containing protein